MKDEGKKKPGQRKSRVGASRGADPGGVLKNQIQPDPNLYQLFLGQVEKTPTRTAVCTAAGNYTYEELDRKINGFAFELRQRYGIGIADRACILLDPGIELVITLFALSRIGAVIIPLSADEQTRRIRRLIRDSRGEFLITDHGRMVGFCGAKVQVIPAEGSLFEGSNYDACLPEFPVQDREDEACILYRAGMTGGRPNRSVLSNSWLVNQIRVMGLAFPLDHDRKVLLRSSTNVMEMLWPLTSGARLLAAPLGATGMFPLVTTIIWESVTDLILTREEFHILQGQEDFSHCLSLRRILFEGPLPDSGLLEGLKTVFPGISTGRIPFAESGGHGIQLTGYSDHDGAWGNKSCFFGLVSEEDGHDGKGI